MKIVTFHDMVRDEFRGYYEIFDMNGFRDNIVQHGMYILKWKEVDRFLSIAGLIFDQIVGARRYLCFHERGIWPNSENIYLMESLCNYSLGKNEFRLHDVVELESDDRPAGVSFTQLALEFGWGGLIFSSRTSWFYFSHDSYGVLSCPNGPSPYLSDLLDIKKVIQS